MSRPVPAFLGKPVKAGRDSPFAIHHECEAMYKQHLRTRLSGLCACVLAGLMTGANASESASPTQRNKLAVITLAAEPPPSLQRAASAASDCEVEGLSLAPQFFSRRMTRERQLCQAAEPDVLADNHHVVTLIPAESR